MREAWREADRAAELVDAARAWRAAGLLESPALADLEARHPQAGARFTWPWRVLVFLCTFVGTQTATVLVFVTTGVRSETGGAALLLACGLVLAFVTDLIVDANGFRQTGAEAATSLVAVGCLAGASLVAHDRFQLDDVAAVRLITAWTACVFGLAAWRWGFRLYAGAGAAAVLFLAAQLPGARLLWAAAAVLVALAAGAALRRLDLAPSHRGGVELARTVALAALYVAVNYYSVEKGLLEEIGRAVGARRHHPEGLGLLLAGAGSVLYPLGLLAWGVRARDRAVIDLGIVCAALSLATLRFYVHVAPLWAVLAVGGALLAGAAVLLERWLGAGPDGERGGFTTAPLFEGERREQLLPAAAALALAPGARQLPGPERDVDGGGGGFGGGGAGGSY